MRNLFKVLCSALLSFVMLFACVGCGENENNEKNSSMKCAPCTVIELRNWNEEVFQEFFYLRMSTMNVGDSIKCTVNGEEWTRIEQMAEDLPEGKYTIVFYTPKDFTISIRRVENGTVIEKEVPYSRKVMVEVEISSRYDDICDFEYRQDNGLWVDPATRDWYEECRKELEEMSK